MKKHQLTDNQKGTINNLINIGSIPVTKTSSKDEFLFFEYLIKLKAVEYNNNKTKVVTTNEEALKDLLENNNRVKTELNQKTKGFFKSVRPTFREIIVAVLAGIIVYFLTKYIFT
ncbi:hypothetical protein LS482_16120 [Sinomicrobium kalidii]|uniref:hypothetical protein n=1 Tax=Sinomicrobium kalidii TaxID=2900738 RepID=UPI001E45F4F4|nr:hypothetical protein [Sinomicrobium kalidii]UGU15199.1 hypothetical protein LS482_16120 [Sinomicrobium kalidii]